MPGFITTWNWSGWAVLRVGWMSNTTKYRLNIIKEEVG
jgi:hypothetical protein